MVSDTLENTYQYGAAALMDGRADTGWISSDQIEQHWVEVEWRSRVVTVHGIKADFTPMTATYPSMSGGINTQATTVHVTSVLPTTLGIQWRHGNAWGQILPLDGQVQWDQGQATITLAQPQVDVTALHLHVGPGCIALRSLQVHGPGGPNLQQMQPRWRGQWIWGDPQPIMPRFGPTRRYFRKTFPLRQPGTDLRAAHLQFIAHDKGSVYLNGHLIAQTHHTGPGVSPQQVRVHVPTELFVSGLNVLAIEAQDLDLVGLYGVLAELTFDSRSRVIAPIVTDTSFQASSAPEPGWRTQAQPMPDWPAARVQGSPNSELRDSMWHLPFTPMQWGPAVELLDVALEPRLPQAGRPYRLCVTVQVPEPLDEDYAMQIDFGSGAHGQASGGVYARGQATLPPDQALTKGTVGKKTLQVHGVWPRGTPPRLPAFLRFVNAQGQLRPKASAVGQVDSPWWPGRFHVVLGETFEPPAERDFAHLAVTPQGTLTLEGQPIEPIIFSSSIQTPDRVASYLQSGVRLLRIAPTNHRNSPIAEDGHETLHHQRLIQSLEVQLDAIHAMDRQAKVLLTMTLDFPPGWIADHPEETIMLGSLHRAIFARDGNSEIRKHHESPASSLAQRKVYRDTHAFISQLRQSPYASMVAGVILLQGRAGANYWGLENNNHRDADNQWVIADRDHTQVGDYSFAARRSLTQWLSRRYPDDAALAAAWRRPGLKLGDLTNGKLKTLDLANQVTWRDRPEDRFIFRDRIAQGAMAHDFLRHHNEARPKLIGAATRAIKDASGRRLLTGAYQAYSLIAATNSPPGMMQHSGHAAFDAIMADENLDTLTSPHVYWSRRSGEAVMNFAPTDSLRLHGKLWLNEYDTRTYRSPIAPKTFSRQETLHAMRREFGAALARRQGLWWLEFGFALSGPQAAAWFDDDDILADVAMMRRIYQKHLADNAVSGPRAQVAVITSAGQGLHSDMHAPANTVGSLMINHVLTSLHEIGAAVASYDLSDLPLLAELADQAGVLRSADTGVLCWADESFLVVSSRQGKRGVTLDAGRPVTWVDPFTQRVEARQQRRITVDLSPRETRFFCLDRDGSWESAMIRQ